MENYKTIEGFAPYSVSDHGRVKNNKTGRILKYKHRQGYTLADLSVCGIVSTKTIHQLVARAFIENPEGKRCVDHIDNDRSNNMVHNLRWATYVENGRNRNLSSVNISGVKGVSFQKASQKWQSQITIHGIQIHLGTFTNIEDAKQARITKANQVFGLFTHSCEKII
jgi:hypothetical protein